jgi:hypothetical protein
MKRALILPFLPVFVFALGAICNDLAVSVNHDRMPVIIKGCNSLLDPEEDRRHSCATEDTRLVPLIDYIPWFGGRCSLGDLLLWSGEGLTLPCFVAFMGLAIGRGFRREA